MSEPLLIQRVPTALANLLSLQSGDTPRLLSGEIAGVVDLMQFYGLSQRQTGSGNNGTSVEGGVVGVVPSTRNWTILFAAVGQVVKTASMTALRLELFVNRSGAGASMLLFAESLGPFGATETGTVAMGGFLHYPLLLPPNSTVFAQPSVIGTDANANVTCTCEFGVLG